MNYLFTHFTYRSFPHIHFIRQGLNKNHRSKRFSRDLIDWIPFQSGKISCIKNYQVVDFTWQHEYFPTFNKSALLRVKTCQILTWLFPKVITSMIDPLIKPPRQLLNSQGSQTEGQLLETRAYHRKGREREGWVYRRGPFQKLK